MNFVGGVQKANNSCSGFNQGRNEKFQWEEINYKSDKNSLAAFVLFLLKSKLKKDFNLWSLQAILNKIK